MADIEGIATGPVSDWFDAHIAGARRPYDFEMIAGGRSNLTFRVTDGSGQHYVLRRPPTSHVLPSAHDMGREHRIISSLAGTGVPVPPALGYCDDEAVNGRPFYVMGYVDGTIIRDVDVARTLYTPDQRRAAGEDLIDVLVALHGVDVDAVGLGDLGRREGYIERQLRRWYGQFQQSAATQSRTVPVVDEVHDFLAARIPEQQGTAIVHGDYRLDNTMFDADGKVVAVLDWELCTLGDPLADMGLLMVYWTEPGDHDVLLGFAPTAAEGFPTRAELRERYTRGSDRDLSALDFYVAFGYWKLACIIEGVYARYAGGAMGGDRSNFTGFADQVETLGTAAREAAAKL